MVKNSFGGNKAKKFARKNSSSSSAPHTLITTTNTLHQYAIITKFFGGKFCQVLTQNLLTLRCVIRNKLSGSSKRDNFVALHSFVLVGLYEWESQPKTCDLLYIYEPNEVQQLLNMPSSPFPTIIANVPSFSSFYEKSSDSFFFSSGDEPSTTDDNETNGIISNSTVVEESQPYMDISIDDI